MNAFELIFGFAGVITGLLILFVVLLAVVPYYAKTMGLFVNKSNGLERSGFHLFTEIAPGQVKILERSERPVRMVMNTAGKRFARRGQSDHPDWWQVTDSTDSEDPVQDVWLPLRWWARVVYNLTGLVFTGIYPFQKVREYKLERTALQRKESRTDSNGEGGTSNLVLTVKEDLSDHFRTRQFLFPVHITAAETKDKIPLDIIGVAELEVTNPHKAAFGTDRWDHAIVNLITDAIINTTKKMKLDHALTAETDEDAKKIANAVREIEADEIDCGIQITGFRLLEINPILKEDGLKAIQAEALALQNAKATRIDGSARADALKAINAANEVGGAAAVATMNAEALVRAAEAASKNGGSVILMPAGGQSGSDATQAAILTELKKLNQSNRKGTR